MTLKDAIAFKTGDTYSQTKFNQTNRKLGQLEMYGFVNIKKELDPDQANTLNIKIYLTCAIKYRPLDILKFLEQDHLYFVHPLSIV